jgi:hypothetical protein
MQQIADGDFEEQGWCWKTQPAEDDSMEFGSIQTRCTGRAGETVLITRRSEKGPNVFLQEIKNLEPGRLYRSVCSAPTIRTAEGRFRTRFASASTTRNLSRRNASRRSRLSGGRILRCSASNFHLFCNTPDRYQEAALSVVRE